MAKARNKSIYSTDEAYLKLLCEELKLLGREYRLDLENGRVIQFALPQKRKKSKADKKKEARNKRAESAARRQ